MVDRVSKEKRSKIMSAIKSKNTKPELALANALSEEGLNFSLQYGKEKIDIAFPEQKIAIFVDGCFWHGCPMHSHTPKSNKSYWVPKLEKNKERDLAKNNRLWQEGWKILRFWEHEINNLEIIVKKILNELNEMKKGR
ncbi:MAG: very short patch repair endonuclease [Clostridiales bacterium]|nr:very short patch repair endonuclease [Clostridiales bacterium]